jgi:hypothetical protein
MSIMTERFKKMNWGEERKTIHSLLPGMETYFPVKGYNNIHTHVRRLNDAYDGDKEWTLEKRGGFRVVKRIK